VRWNELQIWLIGSTCRGVSPCGYNTGLQFPVLCLFLRFSSRFVDQATDHNILNDVWRLMVRKTWFGTRMRLNFVCLNYFRPVLAIGIDLLQTIPRKPSAYNVNGRSRTASRHYFLRRNAVPSCHKLFVQFQMSVHALLFYTSSTEKAPECWHLSHEQFLKSTR